MSILKPFMLVPICKQISVVILQLEMNNYHIDWLLSNINKTRVSILLQANYCKDTTLVSIVIAVKALRVLKHASQEI